ncbi:MAG: tetratricopeptide repeat protein [Candidatus Thorarchaeota archaeon]
MSELYPEKLQQAEELMYNAKYSDALATIESFEKEEDISEEKYLSSLILKGNILNRMLSTTKAISIGEQAYELSKKLDNKRGIFESLIIRSHILFLGKTDKSNDLLIYAEKLSETLTHESQEDFWKQEESLNYIRAWVQFWQGDYNQGLKHAEKGLEIAKKTGNKLDIAKNTLLKGLAYGGLGNFDQTLILIEEAINIFNEFEDKINIAWSFYHLGNSYFFKGMFDEALDNYNRSLDLKECPIGTKNHILINIGQIFLTRGELDKALNYFRNSLPQIDNLGELHLKGDALRALGDLYRMQGDFEQALKYFKQALKLGKDVGNISISIMSLFNLVQISIEKGSIEQAKYYIEEIDGSMNKEGWESVGGYGILCRALLLKSSTRIGKLTDAERLLRKLIEDEFTWSQVKVPALINLCDLLITELKMTNDSEILDDIIPLITQLTQIAEVQHSYFLLAEVNLLKGRLELIKLNLDLARQFLTRAQKIADEHGLQFLAQKISQEHDLLLGELEAWHNLKRTNASLSQRLILAPIDDITDRMLGKRAVEPPEITEEEPILLLIMSRDGVSYFTHSFKEKWDSDWLFSSFMSAFDTFSSQLFSESIDRIKIGDNTILINPYESFLVCYVIKGQSYPALQKLNRFSDAIKWNTEIKESLNRAIQTGEVLELNNPQSLGDVVNEVFNL